MNKYFLIFILAFLLNAIWENVHSFLYDNYMGGKITEFILLRASIVDAIIITILCFPFLKFLSLKNKSWLIVFFGIFIAILIELFALSTGRWAYNEYMPIIPVLRVGLTPTIQLGFLGYLSYLLVVKIKIK